VDLNVRGNVFTQYSADVTCSRNLECNTAVNQLFTVFKNVILLGEGFCIIFSVSLVHP